MEKFYQLLFKKQILKLIFHCLSNSRKNVLRGLHIQTRNPQGKFLTVVKGEIFDVVDLQKFVDLFVIMGYDYNTGPQLQ